MQRPHQILLLFSSTPSCNGLKVRRAGYDLHREGFTLIELLAVVAIMAILAVLAIPAFTSIFGAGGLTTASYDISGAIETARVYAESHDTYTWLGFFEEDGNSASANPTVAGLGRIVIATVASTDGTMIYSSATTAPYYIDPTRLTQISRLIRIQNAHLKSYADGSGTGTTFATRPPLNASGGANPRIGDTGPSTGALPFFKFPLGQSQYSFSNVLQFSPRGEVICSNMAGVMTPLIEVGLQAAHGNVITANNQNPIALQVAGISGIITLYRQ